MTTLLSLDNVTYAYEKTGGRVLESVSRDFESGRFYSIIGKSGAGKSTLLGLLAGLDSPTSGTVRFKGEDIARTGYARHRREHVSLVFQNYNLIDYLTPLENLRLVDRRADESTLITLGLDPDQAKRNVMKLSGGQQQRVAIARALVSPAPVILADEPTGNLDADTAKDVTRILQDAAHEHGKCVIVVTHSKKVADAADVSLRLVRGDLV
ncbi:ABC transporter ATP-binding protein [Eggerthellaceae bacterium zg-997]|nr:ABC transporter ATP-binding protein [Eggerthellaceae bacterium zg-997]